MSTPEEICAGEVIIDGKTYLRCPQTGCNDSGGFPVPDGYGDWEQCQCEFCWTVENSLFNHKETIGNITK